MSSQYDFPPQAVNVLKAVGNNAGTSAKVKDEKGGAKSKELL